MQLALTDYVVYPWGHGAFCVVIPGRTAESITPVAKELYTKTLRELNNERSPAPHLLCSYLGDGHLPHHAGVGARKKLPRVT